MAILIFMKKWKQGAWRFNKVAKLVPGALVVVVVGTLVGWLAGPDSGLKKVGTVPGGLPTPTFAPASVSGSELKDLIVPALMASLIGYMESVSVATKYSQQNNYEIKPNQVLHLPPATRPNCTAFQSVLACFACCTCLLPVSLCAASPTAGVCCLSPGPELHCIDIERISLFAATPGNQSWIKTPPELQPKKKYPCMVLFFKSIINIL
jgi:MFS superfamily sulfate permease-like transporter